MKAPPSPIVIMTCSGPQRRQLLTAARRKYPKAQCLVLLPAGQELKEAEKTQVDRVVQPIQPSWNPVAIGRAYRRLNAPTPALLILPHTGLRYRLAAWAIQPRQCEAWTGHPAAIPIPVGLGWSLLQYMRARCRGMGQVLRIVSAGLWGLVRTP